MSRVVHGSKNTLDSSPRVKRRIADFAKRGLLCLVLLASPHASGIATAAQPAADIIMRFDKSFWFDVGIALAPFKVGQGDLAIVDANLCSTDITEVTFLIVLAHGINGPAPATTLWRADCQKSASELAADPRYSEVAVVAKLLVTRLGLDGGLSLKFADIARTPSSGVSDPEFEPLRTLNFPLSTLQFAFDVLGIQDSIKVMPDLENGQLLLFLSHPQLAQPLKNASAARSEGLSITNNVRILASHAALRFAFEQYFRKMAFAVRKTGFDVTPARYTGGQDSVRVDAVANEKAKATSYAVSATWSGGALQLSNVSAASRLTCASGDIQCQRDRGRQNLGAAVFARLMTSIYGGTPMLPNTGSNKINYSISGQRYALGFSASQTSAANDAVSILANSYTEVAK